MMTATTKYNIGDKVWIIHDNRALRSDIRSIIISAESPNAFEVKYSLHYGESDIPEDKLFSTKEELLKSL